MFERVGYPPYAGYGYGYGAFPGASDILVPGAVVGAYGAVTPGAAQQPADGKVRKDMAALAKRQRDLEESAAAIAKAQAAQQPKK